MSDNSMLLLTDSTVGNVKSTRESVVSNYRASTVRACINAASYPKVPRNCIVTGTGTNDVDNMTPAEFKEQLEELAEKFHENYPSSRIYMLAIPPGTDCDRNVTICQFNRAIDEVCREHRFIFLNTYTMLERKCVDRKHPTDEGKQLIHKVIYSCIQNTAAAMVHKLTQDELKSRQVSYANILRSKPAADAQHVDTSPDARHIETVITQGGIQATRRKETPHPLHPSHVSPVNHAPQPQLKKQTNANPVPHPPQMHDYSHPPPTQLQYGAAHIKMHGHNQAPIHHVSPSQGMAQYTYPMHGQTPGGYDDSHKRPQNKNVGFFFHIRPCSFDPLAVTFQGQTFLGNSCPLRPLL